MYGWSILLAGFFIGAGLYRIGEGLSELSKRIWINIKGDK